MNTSAVRDRILDAFQRGVYFFLSNP
jgi:hypothetical protein